MRKIVTSLVAGGLLVAAAFGTAVLTGGTASAQDEPSTTAATSTTEATERPPRPHEVLDGVLEDLVAAGTITQSQADAITAALEAEVEALREEYPHLGHRGFGRGFRLGALLDDGVIDADELAELPEDHPLRSVDESILEGGITTDELEDLREQFREQREERSSGN